MRPSWLLDVHDEGLGVLTAWVRQRGQLLIHTCAPSWHASTHVLATGEPLVEAAVRGGAEGEVIRARRG